MIESGPIYDRFRFHPYPDGQLLGRCDWAFCNHVATRWRWYRHQDGEPVGWLPVCACHAENYILAV